jgi:hypothetical protein
MAMTPSIIRIGTITEGRLNMALKVAEAKKELSENSYSMIQEQTAFKWASRAAATYELLLSVEREKKIVTWTIAEEYAHEAVEHASLVGDHAADIVEEIQDALSDYQADAFDHLEDVFSQDMSGET